ncbi:MAG: PTS system mannose/fructose/sorbose family transporter subunit IID [Erysipelotrichia bacterium]|nr:PTS system mannose/fructose/sorbose family transporter subunit IID [Erysipelotrichia bacterium]
MFKYFLVAFIGSFVASLNGMTGQALTNRPIVLGPVVGLILGNLQLGVEIGAALELAYMGVMVIGVSTAVNMTVASILGTTYAITTGQGAELAITLAVPCSLLYDLINQGVSLLNAWLARFEIKAAEEGNFKKFEMWHYAYWFWRNVFVNTIIYFIALSIGGTAVQGLVDAAPAKLLAGLKAGTKLIPALGFAMLFNLCYTKEVVAFFMIGYVFAAYMGLDNIAVAILGAAFALIAFFFVKDENEQEFVDDEGIEEKTYLLDKKTLTQIYWRSYQLEADFTSERYQGTGFAYSMIPAIKKLYKTDEERKEALARHVEFFNTTPTVVTLVTGIACAMEEERAVNGSVTGAAISNIKVALMGPLAGIGDAIFWGSYRIICASIACQLGVTGNLLAPVVFLVLFNIPNVLIHYYGLMSTYKLGSSAIKKLYDSGLMDKITLCFSIVGMTMVGAMSYSLVSVNTVLSFTIGETVFKLQEVLDSILPGALTLITVLVLSKVMKKQNNVILIMAILMVIGIVGAFIGIF